MLPATISSRRLGAPRRVSALSPPRISQAEVRRRVQTMRRQRTAAAQQYRHGGSEQVGPWLGVGVWMGQG